MNNSTPSRPRSFLRGALLGGTALALVITGAAIGTHTNLLSATPAYAEAVRVEGAAPFSFADVVEHVRPAVVSVRVRTKAAEVSMNGDEFPFFDLPEGSPMERFFRQFRNENPQSNPQPRQRQRQSTSLGSGFVISEDGLVVTNNHVVEDNDKVVVIFDDGKEYDADVVGTDDRTDLAVLRIHNPDRKFEYVKFSEDQPRVGDWVVAVGNPFGLGGTVTAGIISASGRQIGAGPYDDFLQIDAAVNRGNSGGPAFNYRGEVVGVNTAIFSPSGGNVGIAFAIPASTAERIVNDLSDDGTVVRGWLGVQIQTISDEIASSLRLGSERGAIVAEITSGSPAEGKLQVGDAITAVNGRPIDDSRDLSLRISGMSPGEKAMVKVYRDGKAQEVTIELGTLPPTSQLASLNSSNAPESTTTMNDFGLKLSANEDGMGVKITDVDPNSQAADTGLESGDVILSVGGSEVASAADVETRISEARDEGLEAVLMRVQSGDRIRFIALPLSRS